MFSIDHPTPGRSLTLNCWIKVSDVWGEIKNSPLGLAFLVANLANSIFVDIPILALHLVCSFISALIFLAFWRMSAFSVPVFGNQISI